MKSNTPSEADLIAYLYGELDEKERKGMENYFKEHPEALQHLQQLKDTLKFMSNIPDKEVIAPPVLEQQSGVRSLWQSPYFKIPMSIAASFVLILVAGKLLGPEINYSNGELSIQFGDKVEQQQIAQPVATASPMLSPEQVQEMINASLVQNNETISSAWEKQQSRLHQSIQANLQTNSQKVDDLIKTASLASQDQVRTFVASLQTENLQMMKDYLQLSSNDQKKYIEGLLVDFSKYLQEQRKQDITLFQTRMASIEQNTDQLKQETEQILASIISGPNTKKNNSY